MLDLRLVTVTDDGTALVLGDPDGGSYRLPVDEALGAAVRGDRSRLGQLQIDNGDLRPRDIQTRVRAGISPETLSTQSGMPLERVRRYAGPVLAEREHVAQQAQRATARTSSRGEGPAPVLYDAVEDRLGAAGIDIALVRWDAWRRDDGTWTIEVSHPVTHAAGKAAGAGPARAVFGFDTTTRTAVAEDDAARWLLGEEPLARAPFVPRLAAAPQQEVYHRDSDINIDIDVDSRQDSESETDGDADSAPGITVLGEGTGDDGEGDHGGSDSAPDGDDPDGSRRRDRRAERRARRAQPRTQLLTAPTDRQAVADGVQPGRRASVPSWDEILFGSSRPQQ